VDVERTGTTATRDSRTSRPYEKSAPKHNWWDWYAAYMNARNPASTPEEASETDVCTWNVRPSLRADLASR